MAKLIDDLLDVGRITREQLVLDARGRRSARDPGARWWSTERPGRAESDV